MTTRPTQVALLSLVFFIATHQAVDEVSAQRQRPGSRQATPARQSQRAAARPRPTAAPSSRGEQPPAATAEPTTPATPEPPPTLEQASPDERAAFGQLIEANWIWSPAHEKDQVPVGDVYFRKTFKLGEVEMAQVHLAADNQYELFVNGRPVGQGNDWRKLDVHDVTKLIKSGENVIAVKVSNADEGAAGLVARVITKEQGGTFQSFSSDRSWRTSVKQFGNWNRETFDDQQWLPATEYGLLGAVLPWGDEVVIANEGARFVVDPEFAIERITTDDQTGSLIAMTFNGRGEVLASQEGGPLLLVSDQDADGKFESVGVFSDQVQSAQGILSLGSRVFVVGIGPDGGALYQLTDRDRDGVADNIKTMIPFRGSPGEHGPHAVRLGPDGLLYVMIGNFARVGTRTSPRSAFTVDYEGDLVKPRYEDPRGHAVGVPAPGGTVLRTDLRGSFVEVIAGGLRNAYDFAFNADGEMFTFDADMEWDIGTPWYRPTRINHVPPGAELGWRSGWAKWPEYYLDSLPALLDIGAGSPTGVEYYDHRMFPIRMQNTLLVGDWARGLIHAVELQPQGASYVAKSSVFLKGRPLNVTDLAVGPDGAVYFSTGGRGTDGGIYRVTWKGKVPPEVTDLGQGIERALRQPQFEADWARANISVVRQQMGDQWQPQLVAVAKDEEQSVALRKRAVDLLTFFGPPPTDDLLLELAADKEVALRGQATRLMGYRSSAALDQQLEALLEDDDARVRRMACEAVARRGRAMPVESLVELLADGDRFVAFAARRALEKAPADQWQELVLGTPRTTVFLRGATGLLIAHPSKQLAQEVVARLTATLRGEVHDPGQKPGYISDDDFLNLLRVAQLALERGPLAPADVPEFTRQLVLEYPTASHPINRELVKLLTYLGPPEAAAAFAGQLTSDIPEVEKLHIAAYASRLKSGWQTTEKLTLLRYYEEARGLEGGYSVSAYIENFAREFFKNLTLAERRQVLAAGESYPTSALSVLATLPADVGGDLLAEVRALDQRVDAHEGDVFDRLRVGIVAVLGRNGEPESLAYLRNVFFSQPERRPPIAMSLTQNPDGENWAVLVESLKTVEGTVAREVLSALASVDQRPDAAEAYRYAILQGLQLKDDGGQLAIELLNHWAGQQVARPDAPLDEQLEAWQQWYSRTFPDALPAELPEDSGKNKWTYDELLSFLDSDAGRAGDATRGQHVFREAQCSKCHHFNGFGERIGPDLSTVAQRFQLKEILESIVYPSHVVSDQYASRVVVARGRTYVGMAMRDGTDAVVVLTSDGEKVRLDYDDIEEVRASKQSAMPQGLLNPLTLDQVADLFAYLAGRQSAVAGREQSPIR